MKSSNSVLMNIVGKDIQKHDQAYIEGNAKIVLKDIYVNMENYVVMIRGI